MPSARGYRAYFVHKGRAATRTLATSIGIGATPSLVSVTKLRLSESARLLARVPAIVRDGPRDARNITWFDGARLWPVDGDDHCHGLGPCRR